MGEIIKTIVSLIFVICIIFTIFIAAIIFPVSYAVKLQCENRYWDIQYNIFWWCKIMYQWKYIPENLYIKAFEQNLNINK